MKKNITMNLCGRLYQIDEDAYELLSQYTETLRNYFLKQEGGKEIADDIEERIAELLDELKAQGIEAITMENVQTIIQQIGQVEEITSDGVEEQAETENAESSENQADKTKKPTEKKKFYCDSQNKMLAGVLAGCAQYFGGVKSALFRRTHFSRDERVFKPSLCLPAHFGTSFANAGRFANANIAENKK